MIDILTDWLRAIGSNSAILARTRMPAPWGMSIPARNEVYFHVVTEGSCWVRRPGAPPFRLLQGDLALLCEGVAHDLVDDPASFAIPLEDLLARPTLPDTGGAFTTLVCGVYGSDAHLAHPMLRALPPVVHFPAARVRTIPSLAATVELLTAELERQSPGGEALVQHLFDALFVYVIRAWVDETTPGRPGWLAALKDDALSKALARMHAEPAAPWTVESLAHEAGLSRAAFARRFTEHLGEAPLAYLTRWRMGVASRLLQHTEAPLIEIATRVGYESEFAFSRAFKRNRGIPPARFRRETPASAGAPLP